MLASDYRGLNVVIAHASKQVIERGGSTDRARVIIGLVIAWKPQRQ